MSGTTGGRTIAIRLSLQDAQRVRDQLEALGRDGSAALDRIGAAAISNTRGMELFGKGLDLTVGQLSRVTGAGLGLAGIGAAILNVAKAGDQAASSLAQMSTALGSTDSARQAYDQLYQIAIRTGAGMRDSVEAFTRFTIAAKEAGASTATVLAMVQTVQQAGALAGASAATTAAATTQLGQALASGVLQGDELKSILENMPNLAVAIARELGVGVGEFRKMASEGKLTAEQIIPAIVRAGETMNAEFAKLAPTMERATAQLGVSTGKFLEDLSRALGLSEGIANWLTRAVENQEALRARLFPDAIQQTRNTEAAALTEQRRLIGAIQDIEGSATGPGMERRRQVNEIALQGLRDQLARQNEVIASAQTERARLERAAEDTRQADAAAAAERARQAARERAAKDLETVRDGLDQERKLRRDAATAIEQIRRAITTGATTAEEGNRDISRVEAKLREDIAKLNGSREAQAKAAREAAQAEEELTRAMGQNEDMTRRTVEAANRAERERVERERRRISDANDRELEAAQRNVEQMADRATNYIGESFARVFEGTSGGFRELMDSLVSAARTAAIRIAAEMTIKPLITPVIGGVMGAFGFGPQGVAAAQAAGSGAAGGGMFSGLGQSLGLNVAGSYIKDQLGLTGVSIFGGGTVAGTYGTVAAGNTAAALGGGMNSGAALAGATGAGSGSAAGSTAGAGVWGTSSTSVAGAAAAYAGAIAAGFAVGQGLNSLARGNSENSAFGSAAGAAIGAVIAGPIGAAVGAALGGWAGGAFGSKDHPAYSATLRYDAAGNVEIDRLASKHVGDTETAEHINPQLAALNAILKGGGITVQNLDRIMFTSGNPGDNFESLNDAESLQRFRFQAKDPLINAAINNTPLQNLSEFANRVDYINTVYKPLTDNTNAFAKQLEALTKPFEDALIVARALKISETELTAARDKAVSKLGEERHRAVLGGDIGLLQRRINAFGASPADTLAAALQGFDLNASDEVKAERNRLEQLGLSSADVLSRINSLEEIHGQERINLIRNFNAQQKQIEEQAERTTLTRQMAALRQIQQQAAVLTGFLNSSALTSSLNSPQATLGIAQTQFGDAVSRARTAGPGKADLGAVVSSAQALIQAGSAMYASGPAQAALEGWIRSTVTSLGASLDLPGFGADIEAGMNRAIEPLTDSLDTLRTSVEDLKNELRTARLVSLAA